MQRIFDKFKIYNHLQTFILEILDVIDDLNIGIICQKGYLYPHIDFIEVYILD